MKCGDNDGNAANGSGTNLAAAADKPQHKRKMPKRKRKFGPALYDSRSKKERTGAVNVVAAAAIATDENNVQPTAAEAVATTSKAKRSQKKLPPSQQIQRLEKKAAGFFDECAKLTNELKQEKMKYDELQQENLRLQQQVIDQQNEINELKASHKVEIDKLNKLYES